MATTRMKRILCVGPLAGGRQTLDNEVARIQIVVMNAVIVELPQNGKKVDGYLRNCAWIYRIDGFEVL